MEIALCTLEIHSARHKPRVTVLTHTSAASCCAAYTAHNKHKRSIVALQTHIKEIRLQITSPRPRGHEGCGAGGAVHGGLHPQLLHDTKKDTSQTPTVPTCSLLGRAWPTATRYDQPRPGGAAKAPAIHAHSISVLLLEAFASRPANVATSTASPQTAMGMQ